MTYAGVAQLSERPDRPAAAASIRKGAGANPASRSTSDVVDAIADWLPLWTLAIAAKRRNHEFARDHREAA